MFPTYLGQTLSPEIGDSVWMVFSRICTHMLASIPALCM